ncbi:MAG: AraC family transcriptional regulator [Halioglobus sp.]
MSKTKTSRAAVLRGFDELVSELGGDPVEVAAAAGLELAQFRDPDTLLPIDPLFQILTLSARATGCDHFGLELARRRDLSNYLGILGDIGRSAATVGDALTELFSLMSIHSEATLWQLRREGEVGYVIFSLLDESGGSYKQVEQLVITIFWRFTDLLAQHQWHPTMVAFTFAKPKDFQVYRRVFDVPIVFDAEFCGVVFHSSDLDIELPRHNKGQHDKLHAVARGIRDSKPRNLSEEVRTLIRKNLELHLVGEEYLTQFFPYEKRTLQRKLKAQGTSYRELLHEVRIVMAMELLAASDMPVTRIAERLCYSDVANFTKAFSQHAGVPPTTWRTQIKGAFDPD